MAQKTYCERALAAYTRSLAQQHHTGIPLDALPSRPGEETLQERDDVLVRQGSRTLAVSQVKPDGFHRLTRWPKALDLWPAGSPPQQQLPPGPRATPLVCPFWARRRQWSDATPTAFPFPTGRFR